MKKKIVIFVVFWLLCGLLEAGMNFAYFQDKYPNHAERDKREDLGDALLMGLMYGPIGATIEFFESGFAEYGWRLWDKKTP